MAIAFGGALGSNTNKTTGTTVTLTTGAAVPVGALVVVIWAADNLTATTPTLSSVTDSKSNTYSVIANVGSGTATAAAGQVAAIAVSKLTTALTATDTINAIASSASTVVKAVDAAYFTGAEVTTRAAATTATGNSTAPSVIYGSGVAGDLLLGVVGNQNNALPTGDTDTTNGSWGALGGIASSGGQAAANISLYGQYKILTATGSQTYNVTITSGQWSIAAVALIASPTTVQRTGSGAGLGTQTATQLHRSPRTASGSGLGTQTVVGRHSSPRTATGSGLGTQTAVTLHRSPRTASGSGTGTQNATKVVTRRCTASGSGLGTQTAVKLHRSPRTATGAGLGTQTANATYRRARLAVATGSGSQTAVGTYRRAKTATGAGTGNATVVGARIPKTYQRIATGSGAGAQTAVCRFRRSRVAATFGAGDSPLYYVLSLEGYTTLTNTGWGQAFVGDGRTLDTVSVYTSATSPTSGSVTAYIYSYTPSNGDAPFGMIGDRLATSDPLPYTSVTSGWTWHQLKFSGDNRITLPAGTKLFAFVTNTLNVAMSVFSLGETVTNYFHRRLPYGGIRIASGIPDTQFINTPPYDRPVQYALRVTSANTTHRILAVAKSVTASGSGRGTSAAIISQTLKRVAKDGSAGGDWALNISTDFPLTTSNLPESGQEFYGNGQYVHQAFWYGNRSVSGTPTGNITAYIYKTTGIFGQFVKGSQIVATADVVSQASLPTSAQWVTFTFSGANRVLLEKDQKYAVLFVTPYTGASIYHGNTGALTTNMFRKKRDYFRGNRLRIYAADGTPQTDTQRIDSLARVSTTGVVGSRNVVRTATGAGTGTQTAARRRTAQRTASASGVGTGTVASNQRVTRTTASAGAGTATVVGLVKRRRTASGAGVGTQIASVVHRSPRTATGAGTGTQTVTKLHRSPRTATGAGTGTQTTVSRTTSKRTAIANGLGTQNALRLVRHTKTAVGNGAGTQTVVAKVVRKRTASGSGTGSGTAGVQKLIQKSATGAGAGTQSTTRLVRRRRTATALGIGTQSTTTLHRVTKSASAAGTGTQTALRRVVSRRAATGTGTGSQTAVKVTTRRRAALVIAFGTQSTTQKHVAPRTATATGTGASTVTGFHKVQRTASASGVGYGVSDDLLVHVQTAVGVGSGTATIVSHATHPRTANASGFGSQNVAIHKDLYRNAQGLGGATTGDTAVSKLTAYRTATGVGAGYGVADDQLTHQRTANGTGIGSATTTTFKRLMRTALENGASTSETTEYIIPHKLVQGTAADTAYGTSTATGTHSHRRTSFPSTGFGTQTTSSKLTPVRTGTATGIGTSSCTRTVRRLRQATASGSGTSFCTKRRTVPRTTSSTGNGWSYAIRQLTPVRLAGGAGTSSQTSEGYKRIRIFTTDGSVGAAGGRFAVGAVGASGVVEVRK